MGNFEKFIMLLLLASIPVCAGILSYGAIEYYGLAEQVRNVAPTARAYAIEYRGWLIGGGILYALIRGSFYLWSLHLHTMAIASAFGVAELELNGLIKKYKGQGSRLQRVKERSEWYHDIAKIAPAPVGLFGRADPYPKTVSDDIIAWNEKEAQSKKAARGNAVMTAYLLALLYNGSPGNVQRKLKAELARGGNPYVAPGIDYLSKQHWRWVEYVVRKRGFPKNLVMKSGDGYKYNWDVIRDLTQE
jgi:hypothetical protein